MLHAPSFSAFCEWHNSENGWAFSANKENELSVVWLSSKSLAFGNNTGSE